jgi:serine/threonine-protein kinase
LAHEYLGLAYGGKGRYEEAVTELNGAIALAGRRPVYVANLGYLHAVSGKRDQANRMLGELIERTQTEYVSPCDIASVYAGLGDKAKAFAWLEKAFQERDGSMVGLKADPYWDSLRDDPRFTDLLRRVGLQH